MCAAAGIEYIQPYTQIMILYLKDHAAGRGWPGHGGRALNLPMEESTLYRLQIDYALEHCNELSSFVPTVLLVR